jgi:hypothetical protein
MDWGQVATAGLAGAVLGAVVLVMVSHARREAARETTWVLPNPLEGSPAVAASLAALQARLGPGGDSAWLVDELGGERAAVEAMVGSLQPGLPEAGAFAVNRLVARAPVRLTGEVRDGVAVIMSVERLDQPATD